MKTPKRAQFLSLAIVVAMLLVATAGLAQAQNPTPTWAPLGAGFTYQGHLKDGGAPVTGACDFQFALWDAESGGSQVGPTLTVADTAVTGGRFTTQLDFGGTAFNGDARWLAIAARCPAGSGSYTPLTPRQPLTTAPYALYTLHAPWAGITDMPAGFADNVDDDTLYQAGHGLVLDDTTFSVSEPFIQDVISNTYIDASMISGTISMTVLPDTFVTYVQQIITNTYIDGSMITGTISVTVLPGEVITQVELTEILSGYQQLVTGVCGEGYAMRIVNPDGSVVCEQDTDTTYTAGTGLQLVGTVFSADTAYLQRRVGGSCAATNAIRTISADGTVTCEAIPQGDVTGVTAGTGLSGGGTSGDVTLNVSFAGSGSANTAARSDHSHGGNSDTYWSTTGNAGTTPGTNYLGTSDNQALELRVGGWRALRLDPNGSTIPSLIGGYGGNSLAANAIGGVIGGGGNNTSPNLVTDNYGVVGGGIGNQAGDNAGTVLDAQYAFVGGGDGNRATSSRAAVCGGESNTAAGSISFIGGGSHNSTGAMAQTGTIGGGFNNQVTGGTATIGGGSGNQAAGLNATIGGGSTNAASGPSSTVGGGYGNTVSNQYGAIGGGNSNSAIGDAATIGGGWQNSTSGANATVAGGYQNQANLQYATVGGGNNNVASGDGATVPGGYQNVAAGPYSFAAGRRAKANSQGCFTWGDSTNSDVACAVQDRWMARASGGVYFYTNAGMTTGVYVAAGGGSWSSVSDRNLKRDLQPVDGEQILERLAEVPITTWSYDSQDAAIRHIGPMAQDFYAAFGVGEDDTHITTVDADGVALAAIQALHAENQALKAQIADLDARMAELEKAARQPRTTNPMGWLPLAGGLVVAGGGAVALQRRRPR